MKKNLLITGIVFVIGILSSGCDSINVTEDNSSQNKNKVILENYQLREEEFNGHLYTIYSGKKKGGIVHSPNCKCFRNEESL